jgi:hypothetical protein
MAAELSPLTTSAICVDLKSDEEISEALADHYRAGVGRLRRFPCLARIPT